MTICKKCLFEQKDVMAGQGFREFTCVLCEQKDIWHNTNIPKFCSKCSEKLNMCQRCGASLDEEEKER